MSNSGSDKFFKYMMYVIVFMGGFSIFPMVFEGSFKAVFIAGLIAALSITFMKMERYDAEDSFEKAKRCLIIGILGLASSIAVFGFVIGSALTS